MNQRQRIDYLNEKYLNKKVKIISDLAGTGDPYQGHKGIVKSINERQYQTTLLLDILDENDVLITKDWGVYICDVQLIEEPKIVHQEKKGIVLVKRTIETVDEFGNDYENTEEEIEKDEKDEKDENKLPKLKIKIKSYL